MYTSVEEKESKVTPDAATCYPARCSHALLLLVAEVAALVQQRPRKHHHR